MDLDIATPRWALPLLAPKRYKAAKGGRGSGKSHFFAELLVEEHVANPEQQSVCIREIQKSLKFSAKKLIETKIRDLGVAHLFEITLTEIRRRNHTGIIIFQGMQDHTADSIKSLEGFDRAWVEEAQSLSANSLELLRPTLRKQGSEIWFSWNPRLASDAVDTFFCGPDLVGEDRATVVHVNFDQNPFLPETLREEMESDRRKGLATFDHVWLGAYLERTEAQVFGGAFRVETHQPGEGWSGPYHGLDFGFAQDPTAAVRCWISPDNGLYIDRETGGVKIELDDTPELLLEGVPTMADHDVTADSARPESISYLKRHGIPRIKGAKKGAGSVEDGVAHIAAFAWVHIHPDCVETEREFRLYSYKIDRRSGAVLPVIVDAYNHYIDALRYALEDVMRQASGAAGLLIPSRTRRG